jgi:hypothetical protein
LEDIRCFLAEWLLGGRRKMSEAFVQRALGFGEKLQEFVEHSGHGLAANGLEAELHPETNGSCKNKGACGPWTVEEDAFSEKLDEKNEKEKGDHEDKPVGDEDARHSRGSEKYALHVKGWDEGTNKKDQQKEKKLQRCHQGFFHK